MPSGKSGPGSKLQPNSTRLPALKNTRIVCFLLTGSELSVYFGHFSILGQIQRLNYWRKLLLKKPHSTDICMGNYLSDGGFCNSNGHGPETKGPHGAPGTLFLTHPSCKSGIPVQSSQTALGGPIGEKVAKPL